MGHKKEPTYFFCNFVKNQWILIQFSVLDLQMNVTWRYFLYPPHLFSVATLRCESQNTKNVILQWDITKESCILFVYHCFVKVDQGHHMPYIYLLGVLYSNAYMKQRFTTSMTFENAWCKLGLTLTRTSLTLLLTSGMIVWDHVCTLVVITLNTSSFIWFTRIFYETVNVIWCMLQLFCSLNYKLKLCSHAFSVFQLSQGSVALLIRWGG